MIYVLKYYIILKILIFFLRWYVNCCYRRYILFFLMYFILWYEIMWKIRDKILDDCEINKLYIVFKMIKFVDEVY